MTDPGSERREAYWRANLRVMGALLILWFLMSFGAGILWVDRLNAIQLPGSGFPLGFWFAQQGSILGFVGLIYLYVILMNRIDRSFDVEEE
jgi:putative solute:sodium symporter small subunit